MRAPWRSRRASPWHATGPISSSPTAGELPRPAAAGAADEPARKRGFFERLRTNLSKTRQALGAEIQATLLEGDVDEETWERLEEALIMATSAPRRPRGRGELEAEAAGGEIVGGEALTRRLAEMLAEIARTGQDRIDLRPRRP